MVLVLVDPGEVGPVQQIVAGFLQDIAPQSSQHMPATGSDLKDRGTGMEPTIPQHQACLQCPAFPQQVHTADFSLSTGTDFHVTDQMRPTFDQEQETSLRKGAAGEVIIATVAEGFSIVCCVSYRLHGPIDGQQTHSFPEGPRRLGSRSGSGHFRKEFGQEFTSQLVASVTQSRSGRDLLGYIVADRAQTAHQFAIHSPLRQAGIHMQGNQPVHDGHHIRFSLSFFPHLVGLQKLFYQAWWNHFLQQSHIDLVADLVLQPILCYRFYHEACPFFQDCDDGLSMPSGLPLCLLSFLSSYPLLMRYSYLNSIGVSPQNIFFLFFSPPEAARGRKRSIGDTPNPGREASPPAPPKNLPLKASSSISRNTCSTSSFVHFITD